MVLIRLARDARVASVSYSPCLVPISALISDIVESRSDHLFCSLLLCSSYFCSLWQNRREAESLSDSPHLLQRGSFSIHILDMLLQNLKAQADREFEVC